MASNARWILVSNRMPFNYNPETEELTTSSGGLVTAISGIKAKTTVIWIGCVTDEASLKRIEKLPRTKGATIYRPILVPHYQYDAYYNGIGNDVLWPLLHYEAEMLRFSRVNWEEYVRVNRIFAEKIIAEAKDDDLIWIHDFHLFLVPGFVKEKRPKLKVGFFLHIPFPSSEIYRHLPVREEILRSLICADLIGFHDHAYLRHFCSAVYNVLGISSSLLTIEHDNHITQLGVFPVSVDVQNFMELARDAETTRRMKKLYLTSRTQKLILGVDRLDYIKGIELKLRSFRCFLRTHPEQVGKVRLLQIAVPSRTDVPEYRRLKEEIERLIGEINGEFSTPAYTPVQYMYNSVDKHDLMALYRGADAIFVSSKRDGMNLVCIEYVCAQNLRDPGVVLLSEFAGAASMLGHVLPINPWDEYKTAEAINVAITMPLEERKRRHAPMLEFLTNYTSAHWAQTFMDNLAIHKESRFAASRTKFLGEKKVMDELKKKLKGKSKILFIDYDGTLTPIVQRPEDAILSKKTLELMKKISRLRDVNTIIVSGRNGKFLRDVLGDDNFSMGAEHGAKFFDVKKKKWQNMVNMEKRRWFDEAKRIMKDYAKRTPDSLVETKDFAVAWHYRNSPRIFSKFQARKLMGELESGLSNFPVSVIHGKKVIEVRAMEANKGIFINWYKNNMLHEKEGILIAIGDDKTDEDMFHMVNRNNGISIKVGEEDTEAQYRLSNQADVFDLLQDVILENW